MQAILGNQELNWPNLGGLLFLLDKKLDLQICYFPEHPENHCSLDCLGVEGRRDDINYVYEEFHKQLGYEPGGLNETNLVWKDNPPLLKNNKSNSIDRLSSLVKN